LNPSATWHMIQLDLKKRMQEHAEEVQRCIPQEQRLDVKLESLPESTKAIDEFLGCSDVDNIRISRERLA